VSQSTWRGAEKYIQSLEVVEFSNSNPSLSNIELHALHDRNTQTELCAMILYEQSVTHPSVHVSYEVGSFAMKRDRESNVGKSQRTSKEKPDEEKKGKVIRKQSRVEREI